MLVNHGDASYHVGALISEADSHRLYLCENAATHQMGLLQIAQSVGQNADLQRAAFLLRELKQTAESFETAYARQTDGKRRLDYDRLFPALIDGFSLPEQGNRRVNVLGVKEVDDLTALVPLSNLLTRDRVRIGLGSSAWVMGRLLKLLAFAHGEHVVIRKLANTNILLEPARHFMVLLDWTDAYHFEGGLPRAERIADITGAARAVFAAIGGDPDAGTYRYGTDNAHDYVDFLRHLCDGQEFNAERAHDQFYQLVDECFGRSFRPFETYPL